MSDTVEYRPLRGCLMSDQRDSERLRANEWVFHYFRGNVREALAVELSGPPIKPADVVAAIRTQLLDERLVLLPMRSDDKHQQVGS